MLSNSVRFKLGSLLYQGSKLLADVPRKCPSITLRLYSACPRKAMVEHCIVPDVISEPPKENIIVYYPDTGVYAKQGNILTPFQVRNRPDVRFSHLDSCDLYTLCLTDPDAPSREEPTFREWHHWLVVNIPGNNVSKGETLSAYIGSAPPIRTGLHRYVFLLYRQPGKIACNEPRLPNNSDKYRGGFSISKFAKKYCLGDPVAGNFYLAEYDEHVPYVYKQLGA